MHTGVGGGADYTVECSVAQPHVKTPYPEGSIPSALLVSAGPKEAISRLDHPAMSRRSACVDSAFNYYTTGSTARLKQVVMITQREPKKEQ